MQEEGRGVVALQHLEEMGIVVDGLGLTFGIGRRFASLLVIVDGGVGAA